VQKKLGKRAGGNGEGKKKQGGGVLFVDIERGDGQRFGLL